MRKGSEGGNRSFLMPKGEIEAERWFLSGCEKGDRSSERVSEWGSE